MGIKTIARNWLPPILQRGLGTLLKRGINFSGDYGDWAEASAKASGYDVNIILDRVKHAMLKVKSGEAKYERDSVLFDEVEYSFPLLAGLLRAAAENDNRLSVLDFGGSLGSSYFQCRSFLSVLTLLQWNIVEQEHFVSCGKELFENEELRFFYSIKECLSQTTPNVVLFSSVLQYLQEPYRVLGEIIESNIKCLILDRTIVNSSSEDRIYVQNVPENIYKVSYPCRSLSEKKLKSIIEDRYILVSDFLSLEFNALKTINSEFKGFIFLKKA
jgi:putative methyltransferase (TIGR04325 family)